MSSSRPLLACLSRRYRALHSLTLVILLCCVLAYWHSDDAITVHFRDLGYIARPLWDTGPKRFTKVMNLTSAAERLLSGSSNERAELCSAHGLDGLPAEEQPPLVYDAMIFSVELDLLELRIRELYDVVEKFIVVESNVTFSGKARNVLYPAHADRFAFAKGKIIYGQIGDLRVHNSSIRLDPFVNEGKMRRGVSDIIEREAQPPSGSIILQSDVDEIPSARALSLLRYCKGWGHAIHLGMPSYLYSFEFPMQREPSTSTRVNNGEGYGPRQNRAAAKRYLPGIYNGFTHSRISDSILEFAGWHVTFGFRYLEDFIFKMT